MTNTVLNNYSRAFRIFSATMSRSTAMPPYPDRFYSAAQYANIPGTVETDAMSPHASKFSDLTTLMLYSLYQQVMIWIIASLSRIAAHNVDGNRDCEDVQSRPSGQAVQHWFKVVQQNNRCSEERRQLQWSGNI